MIVSPEQEKFNLDNIISNGIKECLRIGLKVSDKSLGSLEDDIGMLLKALQIKNKLYDYAVMINYDSLFSRYEGKIVYSLVNTEKMNNDEAKIYEQEIKFTF